MSTNNYDDSSIKILEGLEAVRKRPGMYIGSTDSRGLHHLVWEIVDNSIDEALAGYGREINVSINEDNSITVEDFGRGIPIGKHESGKSTIEVIFTVLHAGGKFGGDEGSYKVSGGLHGVGSSVVNALSDYLEVEVKRDGKHIRQVFKNGGEEVCKLENLGKTKETGTKITFKPNPEIFSTTLYNYKTIQDRLRESAFLIKGLKINLSDLRNETEDIFYFEKGITEYVEYLTNNVKANHNAVYFEGNSLDIDVEVAFQFCDTYSENIVSFVNNVRTKDGGTHEVGLKQSIVKTFNYYAKKFNIIKDKEKLEGAYIREGLTAIVSVRIPEAKLEFEGQTKAKLGTPDAKPSVDSVVSEKLNIFLEENSEISNILIQKALNAAKAAEAARNARDLARLGKKRNKKETSLSGKLSPAQGKNAELNELYLVEGDSAGGSAKQGRDRKFQAILPLRGKVINTERAKIEDVLKNEEINTIIHTIGADFGSDFDLSKCKYGKIIIMTDADTDGAHIQVLILTFFFRYMRELIEDGRIYIALPPFYKITNTKKKKDNIKYAWSDEELNRITKKLSSYQIQRYKGLGEMNADQLWETTMDPVSRQLIKVTVEDLAEADQRLSTLMGDKVEPRREWIESNVSFTLEDDFVIEEL